jgi:hypothetical protein
MIKKNFVGRYRLLFIFSAVVLSLSACAQPESQEPPKEQKLGLEEAITVLGQNLKAQLGEMPQNETGGLRSIVYDPILSVESAQQFKANDQIASTLARTLGAGYRIDEISPETLNKAKYIFTGALSQKTGSKSNQPCRLVVIIAESSSGKVVAKGQVDIYGFPAAPLSFYDNSPLFLQDKSVQLAKLLPNLSAGQTVSPEYLQFLPAKANIQKGIIAYEQQQFTDAANAFSKALEQPAGKTLSAHTGLYLSSQKLHRNKIADKAFTNLLTMAFKEFYRLDLRLQFRPGSPAFIPDAELAKQYAEWIHQLSVFVQKNNYCLIISGHVDPSEDMNTDEQLSLSRARTIQGVMSVTYPAIMKKSRVEGKGSRESVIGNGANDSSDTVDRRIELSVVNCKELQKQKTK